MEKMLAPNLKIIDGRCVLDIELPEGPRKPSVVSRVLAAVSGHKELMAMQQKNALIKELESDIVPIIENPETNHLFAELGTFRFQEPKRISVISSALRSYELSSVQFIVDSITGERNLEKKMRLFNALTSNFDNEHESLLFFRFKDVTEFVTQGEWRTLELSRYVNFKDLRGLFSEDDARKLIHCAEGTREHQVISALLHATNALALYVRGQVGVAGINVDLASVIVDYPEEVDVIVSYVAERKLAPAQVDLDLLREYVAAPYRTVSSGML